MSSVEFGGFFRHKIDYSPRRTKSARLPRCRLESARLGNRWHQNLTAGTGTNQLHTFNNQTNRIDSSGYTYDAVGNLLSDGTQTLRDLLAQPPQNFELGPCEKERNTETGFDYLGARYYASAHGRG